MNLLSRSAMSSRDYCLGLYAATIGPSYLVFRCAFLGPTAHERKRHGSLAPAPGAGSGAVGDVGDEGLGGQLSVWLSRSTPRL